MRKYLFLFIIVFFNSPVLFAQVLTKSSQDSLVLLLSKTTDVSGKIQILNQLANSQMQTDPVGSASFIREMIQLIEQCPEEEAEKHYQRVAIFYLSCNVYDQAYEYFLKSLNIAEKLGDQQEVCIVTSNIGGVYLKLFKFEEALDYFRRSLDVVLKLIEDGNTELKTELCALYNNVGLTYGRLGKTNVAITHMEKAIELTPPDRKMQLARYYCNVAPMYFAIGEELKAFDCVGKSIELGDGPGADGWIGYCYYMEASFYYQKRDLKTAAELLDRALERVGKGTYKTVFRDIYGLYVDVCKASGDYKQALIYLEKLYEVKADLVNDDVLSKVTSLKLQYDFDKKAAEQELVMQKEKFKHRLLMTVAGMLIIILMLLYLVVRARAKQIKMQKNELERDLELRNKELTSNVMYLMHNADMVKEIILRLVNLRPNLKPENVQVVKKVIEDLQALTRNDLWSEFETRFNRVHTDFYKKLQEKFPDLTPAELKMCAFLKLNMSSKEISSLTGITSKSVDVMRARIRKKLNISNTEVNLVTFLAEY